MAQIGAKIEEEQALVIQLQKRIKELQVNIFTWLKSRSHLHSYASECGRLEK